MRYNNFSIAVGFAISIAVMMIPQVSFGMSYGPIVDPVRAQYNSYYQQKRKLLSKLDKQGSLTGPEYFALGLGCQIDDTPDSIFLSMSKAAKCGQFVPDYFISAGLNGVPEGFYEASKKLDDAGLKIGYGLLAYALAPEGSEFQSLVKDHLAGLKGAFYAAGGKEEDLTETINTMHSKLDELLASRVYAAVPRADVLSLETVANIGVSSAFKASRDGPFGLVFGMSPTEVSLQEVDSDKYGKDSFNAHNTHYSCKNEMSFIFNGDYVFRNRNVALDDPNLVIRTDWIEAIGQTGGYASQFSKDMMRWHTGAMKSHELSRKYWLTNDLALSDRYADYKVNTYVTASGTRVCAAFYKDKLVRVKANLSAKRDIIPGLIDKLRADYTGSKSARNEYKSSVGFQQVTTYRWASVPKGIWPTVQYRDYKPSANADFSKAYSYGAVYVAPKPQHLQAYAEYTYMPLFSELIGGYVQWVTETGQQNRKKSEQNKNKALSEF